MSNKSLGLMVAVVLVGAGARAADYFLVTANKKWSETEWVRIGDSTQTKTAPAAGNTYWVLGGYKDAGSGLTGGGNVDSSTIAMQGTLCLGAPAGSDFGLQYGNLRAQYQIWKPNANVVNWYNGAIQLINDWNTWSGVFNVCDGGSGSKHEMQWNANVHALFAGNFTSESDGVTIAIKANKNQVCTIDSLTAGVPYLSMAGDNSGYKGSFTVADPYYPFVIAGTHSLGDPSVPNVAALVLPDNGAVRVDATAGAQSATRGIRLTGSTAWLVGLEGEATLAYSVSKDDGVAGTFTKYGAGTIVFDGVYSAGDIVVQQGVLKIGSNAIMTPGQKIVVKDGAALVISYAPGVGLLNIVTEGSGTATYADGYRQTASGEWEVRVSAAASGDGSVSPTEAWVTPGEKVEVTATSGADDFCRWELGGVTAAKSTGVDVFADRISVVADAPCALTALFGLPDAPADFSADGVTGVFADRVLTITVESGKTCTYDYSSSVTGGYVTNIVKKGAGTLVPPSIADYLGGFTIVEGVVNPAVAGVFGKDGFGQVCMKPDGTIRLGTGATLATAKRATLSGRIEGFSNGSANGFLKDCAIVLSDRLTWVTAAGKVDYLPDGGSLDLAGRSLVFSPLGNYSQVRIRNLAITNSSEAVDCVLTVPQYTTMFLSGTTTLFGGPRNVVNFGWDSDLRVDTIVKTDWTLDVNTLCKVNGLDGCQTNTTNGQWQGTLKLTSDRSDIKFNARNDGCLTFAGPITGAGRMPILGGVVNFFSSVNDFAGSLSIGKSTSVNLRSCINVWDGAKLSVGAGKTVQMTDADFWMGENTAFCLPSFTLLDGDCLFSGGASADKACGRASLPDFTKNGDGTLTMDSPVLITGTMAVNAGTLALSSQPREASELPVFSGLVFAANTTFDMQGKDIEVADITGFPTVANAGKLTISGNWTIDYADLAAGKVLDLGAGSLEFAAGATITVLNRGTTIKGPQIVVAKANGGVAGQPTVVGWSRKAKAVGGELKFVGLGLFLVVK